jgi:Fe-S-cluster containining protein
LKDGYNGRRLPSAPILEDLQQIAASKCRRCGACCRENSPITVRDDEIRAIAKHLGERASIVRRMYFSRDRTLCMACLKDPCPFLGDPPENRCLVYEVRPHVCRDFPFLSDHARACLIKEKTLAVVAYCPAMVETIEEFKRTMIAQRTKFKETSGPPGRTIEEDLEQIRKARAVTP